MSDNYERQFKAAMDDLHFSSGDKDRLIRNLLRQEHRIKEREVVSMKKMRLGKVAAVAVALLVVTGGVAYASGIIEYISNSVSGADYKYTYEKLDKAMDEAAIDVDFPKTFNNDYKFKKAAVIENKGEDENGGIIKTWPEIDAEYIKAGDNKINLSAEDAANCNEKSEENIETREIGGITVNYNVDEYVMLPGSAEEEGLSPDMQERLKNDSHFHVSFGSDKEEHSYFSRASFVKDGVQYMIYGYDVDLSADDFFSMCAEIIEME